MNRSYVWGWKGLLPIGFVVVVTTDDATNFECRAGS
jgi:hypothetical protein